MGAFRRLVLVWLVSVCGVLAGGLVLECAGALAAQTRVLEAGFGPDGTAASSFGQPTAVGVDQATGDVYVADVAAETVQKFDSAHEPSPFTGVAANILAGKLTGFAFHPTESQMAVDSTTHDFYVVAGSSSLRAYQSDGEPALFTAGPGVGTNEIGGFGELCGVAVDANGDLYAGDYSSGVSVYAPSGELLVSFAAPGACNLAVDSHGTVYVDRYLGSVVKFSPSVFPVTGATVYGEAGTVDETPAWGIAVDPVSNDLLVDEHTQVAEYQEGGARIGTFGGSGMGALTASAGIAVNAATGRVYVSDTGGQRQVEVFGPPVVVPEVITSAASGVQPHGAELHGSVNPGGIQLSACRFDYGTSTGYGQSVPCVPPAASIPPDANAHAVSAVVAGLTPGAVYHYRLEASNAGCGVCTSFGNDATLQTPPPPSIDSATATNLTATSVDLGARINPNGADTTYHFEWGTSTSYGTSIPAPDADIGAGTSDVTVGVHLSGLTENTTYHWRVVARNESTTTSVDHTFVYDTTGGGLPDGRAYEMVTPAQKNGTLIGRLGFALTPDVSEDGSRVVLSSIQCFANAQSCNANRVLEGEPYLFSRTSGGWVTTALAPPAALFEANTSERVSADAGTALFAAPKPPAHEEEDWYAREPDGSIVDVGPVFSPTLSQEYRLNLEPINSGNTAETADLSHVIQESIPVWPSFDATVVAEHYHESLYEYVGGGASQPVLVGVTGPVGSTDLISICGTNLANATGSTPGTLSADGGTVFFTARACGSGSGANAGVPVPAETLYARIDESRTVLISGRSPLGCTNATGCATSPAGNAIFVGASADGSRVFFLDAQQLTDSASEGSMNLYEYDFASPAGHNLVAVSAGASGGGGPMVQGAVAVSGDGSHVYFVASSVLSGAANGEGQVAVEGASNLYVFERDARYPEGHVAFVAVLSGSDGFLWAEPDSHANVTPDGRFLVFLSYGRLTADDTSTSSARQVFRYDAQTGALVRVSIGNAGFNDNGNAGLGDAFIVPAGAGVFSRAGAARSDPSMSNDGSFVFFESPVGLTPGALNDVQIGTPERGVQYAENVYEYHEGHVYLISDGRDVSAAHMTACEPSGGTSSSVCLIGASGSGGDVFFSTADRLVAGDTDTQGDVYDARICTAGDPCVASAAPQVSCVGEACHGTPPSAPSAPGAGSAVFSGPGNLAPPAKAVVKHRAKRRAKRHRAKRRPALKRRARQSKGHRQSRAGGR